MVQFINCSLSQGPTYGTLAAVQQNNTNLPPPQSPLFFLKVFPAGVTFDTPEEQEVWVREWLKEAGLSRESERLRLVRWRERGRELNNRDAAREAVR